MGCGAPTVNGVPVDEGVVVGGSGAEYASIAAGQAGEAEQSATDTTAAGTVAGTVVLTAAAPSWLAVGDVVVLTDATPGNGLTCVYGVIRVIAGTTLTIDKPWDFGVGESITLIRQIQLTLKRPLAENVTFTKNVTLNLAGNTLTGSIDFTTAVYFELIGGKVTNGITTTSRSVTILSNITYVDRRAGTNYAFIMTSGDNLGAVEVYNCGFGGIVSGRRGYGRWIVNNCTNSGVAETDQNCPWRPFESVAGIAVVITNANVQINSTYSGCIFYSENSITGPTAVVNVTASIVLPNVTSGNIEVIQQPIFFFTNWANGGATLTQTTVTASSNIAVTVNTMGTTFLAGQMALVTAGDSTLVNFSGTYNVNSSAFYKIGLGQTTNFAFVSTQGSGTTTGTITRAGTNSLDGPTASASNFAFANPFNGTFTTSATTSLFNVNQMRQMWSVSTAGTITAGAPVLTFSGAILMANGLGFFLATLAGNISTGTFAFTGTYSIFQLSSPASMFSVGATVSGGTWTLTNTISATCLSRSSTGVVSVFVSSATGGTFTISSPTVSLVLTMGANLILVRSNGAGSSITITNAVTMVVRGFKSYTTASSLVIATTATSTAAMQGALQLEGCEFQAGVVVCEATAVGGVAEVRNVTFNNCVFESTFSGEAGLGTRTYVGELKMRDCYCEGLVTVVLGTGAATGFTVFNAWETFFNGSSGNKSIAASGTRPTVAGAYRFWSCYAKALINDKNPEVVRQWVVRPAAAAVLAWGQVITIAGAGAVATACGAASIVRGVVLDVTAGVGGEPTIIVTDGEVFVKVLNGGAVAASDNLILDPGAFVAAVLGAFTPGQNVGVALEAEDATFADKVYASVRAA